MLHPLRTAAVAALAAAGVAGAAVLTFTGDDGRGQIIDGLGPIAPVALTTQHDCSALLKYYRDQAAEVVGPYGLGGNGMLGGMAVTADAAAKSGALPNAMRAGGDAAGSAPTTPDSTTNVQVAGVDESDVVKTSGDLMVSVVNGEVRTTRLAGADTATLATWKPAEGVAQSVVLDGDRAVVIGDRNGGIPLGATKLRPMPGGYSAAVTDLTVLDLSDPAHPRPVRRLELSGTRSGEARLVDGELRLALTVRPTGITWKQPVYPDWTLPGEQAKAEAKFRRSEKDATDANRQLIKKSKIENWIPAGTVTELDAAGQATGPAVHEPLLDCENVAIPDKFSGLGTLAVLALDLRADAPLTTWHSTGVIAEGSTLYATADHVLIATSLWNARPVDATSSGLRFAPSPSVTEIHRFDTPPRQQPSYRASGEIKGTLLSQFSMDEQDGYLRVASTTEGSFPGDDVASSGGPTPTAGASQGRVTVLKVNGRELQPVSTVTGLGVGEQIRGVRFVGDVGYVVTYRQTDPLYTIDLSDPEHPQVRGELAVLGYSAYLHPAGAGRLLGLGQDGTTGGRSTGLQLSLFDVSDLRAPQRLDRVGLDQAWSDAEGDHHAFTMVGDLVLIPYTQWTSSDPVKDPSSSVAPEDSVPLRSRFDAGVIAVRIEADGIGTPATLRPIANGAVSFDSSGPLSSKLQRLTEATPLRTVVHDGTIYTLTTAGVAAHTSTTFSRLGFAEF